MILQLTLGEEHALSPFLHLDKQLPCVVLDGVGCAPQDLRNMLSTLARSGESAEEAIVVHLRGNRASPEFSAEEESQASCRGIECG